MVASGIPESDPSFILNSSETPTSDFRRSYCMCVPAIFVFYIYLMNFEACYCWSCPETYYRLFICEDWFYLKVQIEKTFAWCRLVEDWDLLTIKTLNIRPSFVNYCLSNILSVHLPHLHSTYRQCVAGRGVGYHILQDFNTMLLTRFRTYKIATPPQTKT